ncbi:MAG: hypothetical protein ABW168_11650 [Sedimenticola sp.]
MSNKWKEFVECILDLELSIKDRNRDSMTSSDYIVAAQICMDTGFVRHMGKLVPEIENVSDLAAKIRHIKSAIDNDGRVYALRFDKTDGPENLKAAIFGGLLVRSILSGKLTADRIPILVDAGNMNSGMAIRYFCEKLGLKGTYIMSRYFPLDMRENLMSDSLQVITAPPKTDLSLEREFYKYLVSYLRKEGKGRNLFSPFHAKHGLKMGAAFGLIMQSQLKGIIDVDPKINSVDSCVSVIGSGASYSWLMNISKKYAPRMVVPEIDCSPVYVNRVPKCISRSKVHSKGDHGEKFNVPEIRRPPDKRITSPILGPHFEEANPFAHELDNTISNVITYSDSEWVKASNLLYADGIRLGNSSVVNLMIASAEMDKNNLILTAIYEPDRWYYRKTNQEACLDDSVNTYGHLSC